MRKGSRGSKWNASERPVGYAVALGVGLFLAIPSGAAAQEADSKAVCVAAYESSQVLRKRERLVEAREALLACIREECPALVRADCGTWLEEVMKAIPSVIVQATADGSEITDVKVSVDGKVVKAHLDGKAITTDPGAHTFRYETPGFPPIETTTVMREGEHYRPLTADFVSPKVVPAPVEMTRPVPLVVWIMGGVTVAGAAGFAALGFDGNQRKQSLENSGCAPFCASSAVDVVHREYLAADISLAAGAAALVAGSIFFFTRPGVPVRVGVTPSLYGMSLGATGIF
jgi:hypothetical protein